MTAGGALLRCAALLLAATLVGPVPPLAAATLAGTVSLDGRGARGSSVDTAVVYFEPDTAVEPPPPGSYRIETRDKRFVPKTLVVPVDSRIRFPNRDPILHNVFSVSRGNRFDLGLYGRGDGEEAVLARPGVVRIYCNVHHSMVAYVLVLDTPFFARPDAGGRYRLDGLPEGAGRLTVWHERAEPYSARITVPASGTVDVELEISRPRVPRHRNKFGREYSGGRRNRY